MIKNSVLIFILVLLSGCFSGGSYNKRPTSCASDSYAVWFEDNNMGLAGGTPPDFISKFSDRIWGKADIDVYMIRRNVLGQQTKIFVTKTLIPYLNATNTKFALDATGATWMNYTRLRKQNYEKEINFLKKLRSWGLDVSYISLQSVLSKPTPESNPYPLQNRIQDVYEYVESAKSVFPRVEIGIIDALPSHGKNWKQAYNQLNAAIDYIHLDIPRELIEKTLSWQELRKIESFVENKDMDFGVFLTSRIGGYESNPAFSRLALSTFYDYRQRCGSPDSYILASWFPYPDNTVPTITNIISRLK